MVVTMKSAGVAAAHSGGACNVNPNLSRAFSEPAYPLRPSHTHAHARVAGTHQDVVLYKAGEQDAGMERLHLALVSQLLVVSFARSVVTLAPSLRVGSAAVKRCDVVWRMAPFHNDPAMQHARGEGGAREQPQAECVGGTRGTHVALTPRHAQSGRP